MNFARTGFAQFMAGGRGRLLRFVAGVALITLGIIVGDAAGIVLMVVGAVPLLAGAFDFCVITALFGGPLSGARIRSLVSHRHA